MNEVYAQIIYCTHWPLPEVLRLTPKRGQALLKQLNKIERKRMGEEEPGLSYVEALKKAGVYDKYKDTIPKEIQLGK